MCCSYLYSSVFHYVYFFIHIIVNASLFHSPGFVNTHITDRRKKSYSHYYAFSFILMHRILPLPVMGMFGKLYTQNFLNWTGVRGYPVIVTFFHKGYQNINSMAGD